MPELVSLACFYERVRVNPHTVADVEFIESITKTFWPTNCWSFAEAAFAIIAPGCLMRPHLTKELIAHPIEAMIAGGLEDPKWIIPFGIQCATKFDHYLEPTDEGKIWLTEEWPRLAELVQQVFLEVWRKLEEEDGRDPRDQTGSPL
jgi:hypothetical protein